jgi:hypothetical protein
VRHIAGTAMRRAILTRFRIHLGKTIVAARLPCRDAPARSGVDDRSHCQARCARSINPRWQPALATRAADAQRRRMDRERGCQASAHDQRAGSVRKPRKV